MQYPTGIFGCPFFSLLLFQKKCPLPFIGALACPYVIMARMEAPKLTDYFRDNVLPKRSYIRLEWCIEALANPLGARFNQKTGAFGIGYL